MTSHHELCGSNWGNKCNCPVENEQRSSNPLAESEIVEMVGDMLHPNKFVSSPTEMRSRAKGWITDDEHAIGEELLARCTMWAADEIERLTAELAGTKDELYSVDKAAKELGEKVAAYAERNAVLEMAEAERCQDPECHTDFQALFEEKNRLRTALEQIESAPPSASKSSMLFQAIARNALKSISAQNDSKRIADETFECPECRCQVQIRGEQGHYEGCSHAVNGSAVRPDAEKTIQR